MKTLDCNQDAPAQFTASGGYTPLNLERCAASGESSGLVGVGGVSFEPSTHTYKIDGVRVPSVTQVLKCLKRPFESERIAGTVGRRDGKDASQVLREWKEKSDVALAKGRNLHTVAENAILGRPNSASATTEEKAWLAFWGAAKAMLKPRMTEAVVADAEYQIAGTVDAVLFSAKTRQQHVFDWKTGKFLSENPWGEMLLSPFDDVPACQLMLYSLQVSLYRLILERRGEPCGASWIVHCVNVATPYRAVDFRDRLHEWISAGGGGVELVAKDSAGTTRKGYNDAALRPGTPDASANQ